MRKIIFLTSLLILACFAIIISCNKSETRNENTKNEQFQFISSEYPDEDFGQIIGIIEDGVPKIIINEEEMLDQWNENIIVGEVFTSVEIKVNEEDERYYLVARSETYASTYELLKGESGLGDEGVFVVMKTNCTSVDCASCCGCTPKGGYCTPCSKGSCSRTTSSGGAVFENLSYKSGYTASEYM